MGLLWYLLFHFLFLCFQFDPFHSLLSGLIVGALQEHMEVLDFLVDFCDIFSDGLVVLIAALDVLFPHFEEKLSDQLVVSDHLAPAGIFVVFEDVELVLLVVELFVSLAVDLLFLVSLLTGLLVICLAVKTGAFVHSNDNLRQ